MRLVSISGAPEAGKTTLWNQLRATLGGAADFVPDLPRQAIETLDPGLEPWRDLGFQQYVGWAQLLREEARPAVKCRVLDKSLIDAAAYWDVLFNEARPRWASVLAPHRYSLALLCEHREITPLGRGSQRLHLPEREQLAAEIRENAPLSSARVVLVAGDPEARLRTAIAAVNVAIGS